MVLPSAYDSRLLHVTAPNPQWTPMGAAETGAIELFEQFVRHRVDDTPQGAINVQDVKLNVLLAERFSLQR